MFLKLTEEQRRMVATVRALAQTEFKPRAVKYLDGTFPWENMKRLAELGVLGMAVPEPYGGLGATLLDTALVLEEIAKTCYVTAMAAASSSSSDPPISPMTTTAEVLGSAANTGSRSQKRVPLTGSPPTPTHRLWPSPRDTKR